MRQLQIGGSATLVILSHTELKKLYKHAARHHGGATAFILEDKVNAPGLGIMVEDDFDHETRPSAGEPRTIGLKGSSRRNRTKRPRENPVNTP